MREKTDTVTIRELDENDAFAIMQIEPSIYGDHHWSKQTFVNELTNEKSFYFGAFDKESQVLLAYTGFWLIVGEAHITTLAVHPDHRRKSIGERLLINTIIKARELGAEWLTLEVRESNEAAKGLYFKYGFSALGLRKRYYQDNGENALVLWTDKISEESFQNIFNARVAELGLEPV
ncbi:ribosomal protein S18-alanine N-acetyltransferase [bacterium]|nr:ribosomal protein S18-alanine N-acetyltransferase [bacterium]QQR59407.1 MAG: ribosomal protein S18-alanine N-acetyltransferase [Candidatus Melainabacteria bacterium]